MAANPHKAGSPLWGLFEAIESNEGSARAHRADAEKYTRLGREKADSADEFRRAYDILKAALATKPDDVPAGGG